MANRNRSVIVEGEFIREAPSGKAVLIEQDGDEYWIPVSQIRYSLKIVDQYKCKIPFWLAEEKGLEFDEEE